MPDLLSAAWSIGADFLIGTTLLVCHELGHYLMVRALGVQARCFVVGLGPTLARGADRRGTEWRLRRPDGTGSASCDTPGAAGTLGHYGGGAGCQPAGCLCSKWTGNSARLASAAQLDAKDDAAEWQFVRSGPIDGSAQSGTRERCRHRGRKCLVVQR